MFVAPPHAGGDKRGPQRSKTAGGIGGRGLLQSTRGYVQGGGLQGGAFAPPQLGIGNEAQGVQFGVATGVDFQSDGGGCHA